MIRNKVYQTLGFGKLAKFKQNAKACVLPLNYRT